MSKLSAKAAARTPRKVLVLGGPALAGMIAQSLGEEGFEPHLLADTGQQLPSIADPDAIPRLLEIFQRFAATVPRAGGFANLVHPGTSPWGERPEFPTLAQQAGLSAVTPPPPALALFANKLNLLETAERLGIPNLVLSYDPMHSAREIERLVTIHRQSFPLVLKSIRGGSVGIYVVQESAGLGHGLTLWLEQLHRNSGEVIVFAERYLEGARLVTVPFCRLPDGTLQLFPFVDASLQCRHRKVVEICPASIDAPAARRLQEWTEKFLDEARYVGFGTLDYLVEGSRAYLIDGLSRLNSSFHLWEQVAGTRAVSWQLRAMEGGHARETPALAPRPDWAAGASLRLLAEDPILQLPQPGKIQELSDRRLWSFPGASGELYLNVEEGQDVSPTGESIVGFLFTGGRDHKQAVAVARGVLNELWVAGSLQTNERFLAELLSHPWVREGMFSASFVDEEFVPSIRPPAELLRLFAGVAAEDPRMAPPAVAEGATPPPARWAVGDQWAEPLEKIQWVDEPLRWELHGAPGLSGVLETSDGKRQRACLFPVSTDGKWQARIGAWTLMVRRVSGAKRPSGRKEPRALSLISGRVHSLLFREGSVVPAHEPFALVESLGALVPHASPVDIRVRRWRIRSGDGVSVGQDLAEIELAARE